jgi:hypothetical protein
MQPDLFKASCEEFHREVNRFRTEQNGAAEAKLRIPTKSPGRSEMMSPGITG